MAARKSKTRKADATVRKARGKTRGQTRGQTRGRAARRSANLIENVQQIWLAGMGAVARAQKDGPAAFQDAVAEGFKLLSQSRSSAEEVIRDAFESAQDTVQARIGSAREQASETWDNLEALFQSRVHKAMQQLGVPSAEEIRLLTRRVAELNASVQALQAGHARRTGKKKAPRARRKTRAA